MTFPVVGSNIPSAYQISNSLRFNDDDSPRLTKTFSVEGNVRTNTFSCWVKRCNLTQSFIVAARHTPTGSDSHLKFDSSHRLAVKLRYQDSADLLVTNRVFRDVGAWYHIVFMVDSTQATVSDRVKLYVNGVEETSFATDNRSNLGQNNTEAFGDDVEHAVAGRAESATSEYSDLYIAEAHFINGSNLDATSFGEFDENSGVWKPKQYAGTYGTNGFYLKFNNTGNMGEDSSGNDNTFTPTNLSGTADVTTDTPTNNFATLNPLSADNNTLSEGNVEGVRTTTGATSVVSTIAPTSGKWYVEFKNTAAQNSSIGVVNLDDWASGTDIYDFSEAAAVLIESNRNDVISYGNTASSPTTLQTSTDLVTAKYGLAIDIDNNDLYVSANGNWYGGSSFNQSDFSNATAVVTDLPSNVPLAFFVRGSLANTFYVNFGNAGGDDTISSGNSDGNGYGNFEYAPPSGYLALCTQNLATALSPTIDDGSEYFNTKLYTGTGSATSITGVGFQPDFTWIKQRNNANNHKLMNSTAGSTKFLVSANTDAEGTDAQGITSFDSDGFSLGTSGSYNGSGGSYVSWNWLANGGTTSSNTDGSITSTVQANTTAGFSIITYTGTGANATVGHGLGKAPTMTIHKRRDSTSGWLVYHQGYGATKYTQLNSTDATTTASFAWNDTEPTSSVISLGYAGGNNASGGSYVAYCFADVEGYSKFGSYTGNGSSDGTFVYTGFKPAFTLIKRTDTTQAWVLHDSARAGYINPTDNYVYANATNVEAEDIDHDYLSNGFKIRATFNDTNASGGTYIYMAFAENPFVTSGATPVTAR